MANPIPAATIRPAAPGDEAGLAYVHASSWKTTYTGLIDPDYLAQLDPSSPKRIDRWGGIIAEARRNPAEQLLLVAEENDRIIGFASGGRNREENTGFAGELKALYLLKEAQGKGIGRHLFTEFTRLLVDRKFRSMIIWCLESNSSACGFYEKMGGLRLPEHKDVQIGRTLARHVAYGWHELRS